MQCRSNGRNNVASRSPAYQAFARIANATSKSQRKYYISGYATNAIVTSKADKPPIWSLDNASTTDVPREGTPDLSNRARIHAALCTVCGVRAQQPRRQQRQCSQMAPYSARCRASRHFRRDVLGDAESHG